MAWWWKDALEDLIKIWWFIVLVVCFYALGLIHGAEWSSQKMSGESK